jgi:hypothetical protein
MEDISTIIIIVILMIPLYGALIWTYLYPEESILFGKRWMYQEEPELSEKVIRYVKFTSMVTMIGLPIVLISIILSIYLDIYILGLVPVIFILVLVIGAFILLTSEK